METELLPDESTRGHHAEEVARFYTLAKRVEWQLRDLGFGERPPIPELRGSPQRQARRRDVWRSVIQQQLQADELAVEMATQLFSIAEHHEASHTEAWLQLVAEAGGPGERDPYLDQMASFLLNADTLEEKVFLMQVFL